MTTVQTLALRDSSSSLDFTVAQFSSVDKSLAPFDGNLTKTLAIFHRSINYNNASQSKDREGSEILLVASFYNYRSCV